MAGAGVAATAAASVGGLRMADASTQSDPSGSTTQPFFGTHQAGADAPLAPAGIVQAQTFQPMIARSWPKPSPN